MKYVFDIPEEMLKCQAVAALGICLEEQIEDMYDEVDAALNR